MDIFVGVRRTSPRLRVLIVSGLLLTALFTVLVGASFAGKTSYSLAVADGAYGETTMATLTSGSSTVSAVSTGQGLWVRASCSQGGLVVYRQNEQLDSSGHAVLTLGPTPVWGGGAADCVADSAYYSNGRWRTVASTTFHVSG